MANSIFNLVFPILVFTISSRLDVVTSTSSFNVVNYGAKGDSRTDDSKAFLNAWNGACGAVGASTLVVPGGKTFLLQPATIFNGPCKASSINVQVWGNIIAPMDPSTWKGVNPSNLFSAFKGVNGLSVTGPGSIIGRGQKWWAQSCKINPRSGCTSLAPTLLGFYSCSDLVLGGLKFIDSPQFHITLQGCNNVNINNLKIKSPETSPNTDGIHIQNSNNVTLTTLAIETGDDCISIGDRTSNININTILCGPGHGISIGSLGKGGTSGVSVEKIEVKYVKFIGTTNGARIKTWQGGSGHADQIKFEHLEFFNVENPIIIDQNYCDQSQKCKALPQGVKISNVSYKFANGTSSTPVAINLNCDETVGCTGIVLQDIDIKSADQGKQVRSSCTNSHGRTIGDVQPRISCLS